MKPRILVIDDESAIRDSLKMILEYEGYEVQGAATGQDGLALADREAADLVLLDIKMAGMDGLEVLQRLRATHEALPVIMISGHATVSTAVEATKLGAFDFIEKPLSTERVLVSVRNALDQQRLTQEVVAFRRTETLKHQLVGESAAVRGVLEAVKRAAPTSATVLITGESGVGKELVARAIHRNSLRARERFIQVNCAAIPDDLIESELFGHEKGSFTGATEKQVGKFEQADRGTIFLDEVGDMSLKTQAKVLRVLQEQELERLGSNRVLKVDVRVIAATNKNLEEEISKGTFREDLFYRLNVIPILVPPLRERKDDIPTLVRHFADLFSRENNFRRKTFTPAGMDRLRQHHWRGNIRELRNFVERIIIMSPGDQIDAKDLPDFTGARPVDLVPSASYAMPAATPSAPPLSPETDWMRAPTLQEFKSTSERAFLVNKLRETGWNISKTAEVIDTPRSNLYKKLEQYQISQETDG
jgi:two-component system nitrogen regulation response regulator NtrX